MTPEVDIATHLHGLSTLGVTYTLQTNMFYGPERPASTVAPIIPEECLFICPIGGSAPEPYLNGGATSFYQVTVQLTLRAAVQDFMAGLTKARAILSALHSATVTGYTWCFAQNGDPVYIGPNAVGQPRWILNFELAKVQA